MFEIFLLINHCDLRMSCALLDAYRPRWHTKAKFYVQIASWQILTLFCPISFLFISYCLDVKSLDFLDLNIYAIYLFSICSNFGLASQERIPNLSR